MSGTDDYGSLADTDLTISTIVVSNSYQLSIDMTGQSVSGTFQIVFGALQTDISGNSLVGSNSIEYTLDTTGPILTSANPGLGQQFDSSAVFGTVVYRRGRNRGANRSYLLSVIADEKDYYYQIRLEGFPLFAGNPMDVSVLLSRKKELPPLDTSISVEVKSPSEAMTNIVSNYKPQVTLTIPGDNVGGKTGELNARIEKLLKEPKLLATVRKKKITSIKLSQSPMNLMTGAVTDLTTQGYHKVRVIIRHKDRKNGVYERVVDRTFKISVCPDQKSSKIDIIGDGKYLKINVLPKNKYVNLLGPGYEKKFPRVFLGYKIPDIADNLDGSYTIRTIQIGKSGMKPKKEEVFRYLFPG